MANFSGSFGIARLQKGRTRCSKGTRWRPKYKMCMSDDGYKKVVSDSRKRRSRANRVRGQQAIRHSMFKRFRCPTGKRQKPPGSKKCQPYTGLSDAAFDRL